jgi:hypothetical protein
VARTGAVRRPKEVGTAAVGETSVTWPTTLQDYSMPPIDSAKKRVDCM